MDDRTITVSIGDEQEEFIAEQLAAGNYSDEGEILRAGLAALERETKLRELRRLIAEGDEDFEGGDFMTFDEPGELTRYIVENAKALK